MLRIKLMLRNHAGIVIPRAESPFPCDYVTSIYGYCKRVMTSTTESKRVLKITNCSKNEDERTRYFLLLVDLSYIHIYIYIYIYLNTLSGGKSCLVAPGVAVPLWATETVLSLLVGDWWGQGITRAFTRCMMKKKWRLTALFITWNTSLVLILS